MKLQELVQTRHDLNCNILKELQSSVIEIKLTSENMIECATNMTGQGYSMFIRSREEFLDKIDSLYNQIESIMSINSSTR